MQRQIVLQTLNTLIHPYMDEIYDEIHIGHPSISKTTVYRNLRQLSEDGIIRQLFMPDGLRRYDRRTDSHYHFKCKNCEGIFDVDMEYLDGIDGAIQAKQGFNVEEHSIVFWGFCTGCMDRESGLH